MINKILVSACLTGLKVRYDGSEKAQMSDQLQRWQKEGRLVIFCPE
ncbi:2-thiouracil desulfurase family protein, partial [Enterobacter hormaechei]